MKPDYPEGERVSKQQVTRRNRHRTSWNGWRIVAGGVLVLIFGFTFLSNNIGPAWLALGLLAIGVGLVVYGRRH